MKFTFDKPVEFEGRKYDSIDMKLEAMTGADFIKVKKGWAKEGNFSAVPASDCEFCMRFAAMSTKLPLEFFEALPAPEYNKIYTAVFNFLMA